MDNQASTNVIKKEMSDDQKMVSGSAWMTASSMVSRVLGIIYIIPWMAWMGGGGEADAANALFQIGYNPYAFFLALATAGVPSAISKQISHYNAIGEYEISKSIYKQGLKLMIFTGVVSAVALYVLAPALASTSPTADAEDAVIVMRALVPALLIIPAQSVTRGFLQGHNTMAGPAISQIIEQFARILFMLASAYAITQVLGGSNVTAVSYSTFAAFIGAIFSLIYLAWKIKRIDTAFNHEPEDSVNEVKVSPKSLLVEIVKTSIPFIIIATGITLFQQIDQNTYKPIMEMFSNMDSDTIQATYGVTQANAHKLIMILTSFGTALSITTVPLISNLMAKSNVKEVSKQFSKGVQLLFFAMFPAAVGMAVVAEPLYNVFFRPSALGTSITQVSAYMAIFIALYAVLGNMLQAANQTRPAIWALVIGFVVKIVTQPLFVGVLGLNAFGMLYSTIAGFGITCFLMMRIMHKATHYSIPLLFRRSALIMILSLIMGAFTMLTKIGLGTVLNFESKTQAGLSLPVMAAVGIVVYGYLVLKTRLADRLIGAQAARVRNKLKIN
ncbi:polysaccharide biosynthesis protein [Marinilactibacillus sp. Marseille-P9653]|uniref:putative polysaccharide biosynthesis protein n=1 Tax=Marinilactibacillus sp. Marseille-P9653 TaxID=2866583 RepID=UPI001CE4B153|nr:polysaccharide biosynthesis protein [Marinilactibacillus sp. Marseille-P9653]